MSEELKPCPFCGGEAELDTSQAYRALSGGALGFRAVVYCARCGADMGFCYEDAPGTPREDIVNQVVDDWNRRAPSPDMREAVEARREITSMIEMLERLAAGDTIHFSQDGDMAWFGKGDRAFVAGNPVIEARRLGYLERKCGDEENYRGTSEYDTISDKGRIALRSLTGAKP